MPPRFHDEAAGRESQGNGDEPRVKARETTTTELKRERLAQGEGERGRYVKRRRGESRVSRGAENAAKVREQGDDLWLCVAR